MSILGIILALAFLIYFAYRGASILVISVIASMIAIIFGYFETGSAHVLAEYTVIYMKGTAGFLQKYFPVFLLGAIFGKLMEVSGAAKEIAQTITRFLGKEKAILSIVISAAILTYGGVSLFVVVFAVYPIAAAMFKETNIPKRLIPAAIALGAATFSMTALPGTPAIQNVIPTRYLGTDVFAAPILGIVASIIMFSLGVIWLNFRAKKLTNEGYGEIDEKQEEVSNEKLPKPFLAFSPIVLVIILNFVFSKFVFSPNSSGFSYLSNYGTNIIKEGGNWAVITSLMIVILFSIAINWRFVKGKVQKSLNQGANGAMAAILNTAVVVGFGVVIKGTAGFATLKALVLGIKGSPLISFAVATTTLAGVTGSASGGLGISMEVLSKQFISLAQETGLSLEVLHRVASIAAGGLDSLPHSGAVITLLIVCGLNHKKSYGDIGVVTVLIPIIALIATIILGSIGIV
ncbi:MAG: GntP family permease [Bacteroidota bacterium]